MRYDRNPEGQALRRGGTRARYSRVSGGRDKPVYLRITEKERLCLDEVMDRDGHKYHEALERYFQMYLYLVAGMPPPVWYKDLREQLQAERERDRLELPCLVVAQERTTNSDDTRNQPVYVRVTQKFKDAIDAAIKQDGQSSYGEALIHYLGVYLFGLGDIPEPVWLEELQEKRKRSKS
jgi:hypothetical protein